MRIRCRIRRTRNKWFAILYLGPDRAKVLSGPTLGDLMQCILEELITIKAATKEDVPS
jgi:hypothetical protein